MKICFIHPPYSFDFEVMDKKLLKFYFKEGNITPPLGICYLAAILEQQGHQVAIIDANAKQLTDESILARLSEFQPQILGISILSHAYRLSIKLIQKIKARFPQIRILVGG